MERQTPTDHSIVDALYRISSLVNDVDDARGALEIIVDELVRFFPNSTAAIELINPDTQRLVIEVHRGFPEHSKSVRLRVGEGVTGWVALHGRPLIVSDVREDARYVEVHPDVESEMAVPMMGANGEVVGVVNIDSREKNAFSEHDLKILALLTNEATRVVGKLWLIEKLQEQAIQLRALVNTGRSIVKRRDIASLLHSITSETLGLMKCRACALFLFDSGSNELRLAALAGAEEFEGYTEVLRLEDSALGTALRRKKTIEVQDLAKTEEHHFVELVSACGLVSLLCAPIIYESEVIGVLNAYTDRTHRFSNDERRVFETLAGLSGIAIQNARLYERIFQSEESLRRSEKLTTLGMLSAEIAHEIRNPLTVIRLLFEAMGLEFPDEDPRQKDASVIREKLDQLEGIVTRVLSFGNARQDLKMHHDLRAVVRDTAHLVRLKLQQVNIELVVDEPPEAIMIDASRAQLQQALLNLLFNAMQAIGQDGSIAFRLESELRDGVAIAIVDVVDSGPGIPTELSDSIFDSFLSSKAEGTGLGLSIAKRIMKSHQGDVVLLDSSSSGTTMRIWLPGMG